MESMESLRNGGMENLSDINEEEEKKKGWWRWSDIKENKIVQAFEMQEMYVCWSYFHLSSTLSICLIFSYSLKLLKIADATVVSECQSKCNVHLLLFFFLFAQLWALKRTLCAYYTQLQLNKYRIFLQSHSPIQFLFTIVLLAQGITSKILQSPCVSKKAGEDFFYRKHKTERDTAEYAILM